MGAPREEQGRDAPPPRLQEPRVRSPRARLGTSRDAVGPSLTCCGFFISDFILFNSKICIWFSFIVSGSLQRFSICSFILFFKTLNVFTTMAGLFWF